MYEALWACVQVEGVEPINNAAERTIRPGILWHKGSFGTQSANGSRFVEALMTVVATLKQHRNDLVYMTEAYQAAYTGGQPLRSSLIRPRPTKTCPSQHNFYYLNSYKSNK